MQVYSIFWIKKEFAKHFFTKADIMYRFLLSYEQRTSRNVLTLQFREVTKPFPKKSLVSHIELHYNKHGSLTVYENQIKLTLHTNVLLLTIDERRLTFRCQTLHDAEVLLFPILRLFHPHLFIVSKDYENFGWITANRKANRRQLLYS